MGEGTKDSDLVIALNQKGLIVFLNREHKALDTSH